MINIKPVIAKYISKKFPNDFFYFKEKFFKKYVIKKHVSNIISEDFLYKEILKKINKNKSINLLIPLEFSCILLVKLRIKNEKFKPKFRLKSKSNKITLIQLNMLQSNLEKILTMINHLVYECNKTSNRM